MTGRFVFVLREAVLAVSISMEEIGVCDISYSLGY